MRRVRAALGLGLIAASCLGGSFAPIDSDMTARLEALHPGNPLAYFELAEELADAPQSDADKETARTVFALSAALDSRHLGRSACLALAQMETDAATRRRLLALATLLESHRFSSMPSATAVANRRAAPAPAAVVAAAESLSRYRKGQGALALTAAKEPGAMDVLQSASAAIPGGLERFLEDCKLYRGQVKPNLSPDEVNTLLRLEAALLAGEDRSWSGELLLTRGEALVEVDPDRLEESLGIDASRCVYRSGRWVKP
jgi:hypothetical protein